MPRILSRYAGHVQGQTAVATSTRVCDGVHRQLWGAPIERWHALARRNGGAARVMRAGRRLPVRLPARLS